jgi:glycosyltransferase involved in cell wall biosynthesis
MKRFGANKDMVLENFGRQIRLFEPLAKKHIVHFFCPDYTKKESMIINQNRIKFIVRPVSLLSITKFLKSVDSTIEHGKYDVIVASTDPLIGILGNYYSKKYKIPLVYDLQDNFEIYSAYKLPMVGYLDKNIVKEANVVLTVSNELKKYISNIRRKETYIVRNGIELGLFKDINKIKARKKLNLPIKSKIMVYIGHMHKIKGAELILKAFNKVKELYPDTYLLLSGKIDNSINIKQKNIIFKKFSKREEVVLGINAADVAVLPNTLNKFTKYCFPYKLVEYMACNVPIVATDVGDVSSLLKKYKGSLCKPGDYKDLAEKIIKKFQKNEKVNYKKDVANLTWEKLSQKLDYAVKRAVKSIKTK